jgi:hypothetical protein
MALGKGKYNYKYNATFTSLKNDKTFDSKEYITLRYFWGHGKRGGIMATGIPRLPLKNWKFNDSKKTINYGKGDIVIKCNSDKEYEKAKQVVLKKKPTTKKKTTTKKKASPVRRKLSQRKKTPKKSARILRGKRNSPSTSATSVSVGTKRRGGDGKMYVCKTYKRGNKRVKRWFKV